MNKAKEIYFITTLTYLNIRDRNSFIYWLELSYSFNSALFFNIRTFIISYNEYERHIAQFYIDKFYDHKNVMLQI